MGKAVASGWRQLLFARGRLEVRQDYRTSREPEEGAMEEMNLVGGALAPLANPAWVERGASCGAGSQKLHRF